jgi:starch synthase (maltosyl-transferring)
MRRITNIRFVDTDNPRVLAYVKQTADRKDQLLVIVNFDWHHQQSGHVSLPLHEMGIGSDRAFKVVDLYDPTLPSYTWLGSRNYFSLDPTRSPAHIFVIGRL